MNKREDIIFFLIIYDEIFIKEIKFGESHLTVIRA